MASTCSVDGCDRAVRARDLCANHYQRWRNSVGGGPVCSIDGCNEKAIARGWCSKHYTRWWNHKDECNEIVRTRGGTISGEQNGRAKLNWEKVREIRAMEGTLFQREVGSIYGVSNKTISLIWNGKIWKE